MAQKQKTKKGPKPLFLTSRITGIQQANVWSGKRVSHRCSNSLILNDFSVTPSNQWTALWTKSPTLATPIERIRKKHAVEAMSGAALHQLSGWMPRLRRVRRSKHQLAVQADRKVTGVYSTWCSPDTSLPFTEADDNTLHAPHVLSPADTHVYPSHKPDQMKQESSEKRADIS